MARSSRSQVQGTLLVLSALVGTLLGVGGYTFWYANGASYLSDDPRTCVNCHIMNDHYDGWQKASHHAVAVCNDCHIPHDSFVGKWYVKGMNGYHHSKAFTLQDFHQPILIKPGNAAVLEANCIRCHGDLVSEITSHGGLGLDENDLYGCVRCHATVGHGPTR
jgi:cytochrome c nitrite reductase small subunit